MSNFRQPKFLSLSALWLWLEDETGEMAEEVTSVEKVGVDEAWLEDELSSEQEGKETDAVEEVEDVETDVVEEVEAVEDASRSLVLETNRFPDILGQILSHLDPLSVKRAAQVSR